MRKRLFLLLISVTILFITCSRILDSDRNKLKLNGFIFNEITKNPVNEAVVTISDDSKEYSTESDSLGRFEFDLKYEETTTINFTVEKSDSFETATTSEIVKPGKDFTVDSLFLTPVEQTTVVKGTIINNDDNEPIENVLIKTDLFDDDLYTNSSGVFSFSYEANESYDFEMIISKDYFNRDTINFTAKYGYTTDLGSIYLEYIYQKAYISGTIYDSRTDTALVDVKVTSSEESDIYATTDAEGKFSLPVQINYTTDATLYLNKYPFEEKSIEISQVTPEEKLDLGKIELDPPAYEEIALYGKVKNSSEESIENVTITIDQYPELSETTEENGFFSISLEVDEALDVKITFEEDNYQSVQIDTTLQPETDMDLGIVYLSEKYDNAHIKGILYDQTTGNVITDANVVETVFDKYAISDENGEFDLEVPVSETTSLSLVISKYPYTTKTISLDNVIPSEEIDLGNIYMTNDDIDPATISGILINEEEEPVSGLTVTVEEYYDIVSTSSSTGYFSLSVPITSDNESVKISIQGSDTYESKDTTLVVNKEEDKNIGRIKLTNKYADAVITGTVIDEATETPIQWAKIVNTTYGQYDSTDTDGNFSLTLPISEPENIDLTISKYPYTSKTVTLENITPAEQINIGTVELTPPDVEPLVLSGKIINKNNEAISDIDLTVKQYSDVEATTDSKGKFSMSLPVLVDLKLITLQIEGNDVYDSKDTTFYVYKEKDKDVGTIKLENIYDDAVITGKVVDEYTNSGIADVQIVENLNNTYDSTGDDGSFSIKIAVTEQSDITLSFNKYPYTSESITVNQVTPEQEVDLGTIALLPSDVEPTIVTGTIINYNQQPVDGLSISVSQYSGITATTSSTGEFSLSLPVVDTEIFLKLVVSENELYNSVSRSFTLAKGSDYDLGELSVNSKVGLTTISGIIVDDDSRLPVENVKIVDNLYSQYDSTNAKGKFDYKILLFEPEALTLSFSKYPYDTKTLSLAQVTPEEKVALDTISISLPDYDPITCTGRIIDSDNEKGIVATVEIEEFGTLSTTSDDYGYFTLEDIPLKKTQDLNIVIKPDNQEFYRDTTITYNDAIPEQNVNLGTISCSNKFDAVPTSIVLDDISNSSISVAGSGGTSSSQISFQVLDQVGEPIDITSDLGLKISVGLLSSPGGGAKLSNTELETNSEGIAKTTVISGTVAGVIEVRAYFIYEGSIVEVSPVPINVHAGLPAYFNKFQAEMANIPLPYYITNASEDITITAQVGDKYQNIIIDKSSIYFTLEDDGYDNGSIMNSSDEGNTDDEGFTTVSYWVPDHLPEDEWITMYATTAGENGDEIKDSTEVLLTYYPIIDDFYPSTASISQGGYADVDFTIQDKNGHPMSEGTTIDIVARPDTLATVSHNFPTNGLDDTQLDGDGTTDFTFTIVDNPTTDSGGTVTITITVTGKNGTKSATYTAIINP